MNAKLRENPFSTVAVRYRGGEAVELRVWSVTRRRRATTRNIAKGTRADFDRLCEIATRAPEQSTSTLSIEDFVALTALGLWAPESGLIDPVLLEAPIRSEGASGAQPWPAGGFAVRGQTWLQYGPEPRPAIQDIPMGCLEHVPFTFTHILHVGNSWCIPAHLRSGR